MLRFRIATLAVVLCSFASPALAQAPDQLFTATKQQLDVTKVVIAEETAWNKGDLDGYLSHYKDAPDTEAVLASSVRGIQNIRAAFHLNYPSQDKMGTLEQTEVMVRALGEGFALATGKYHLMRTRKAGGDADGTFTEIFEKTPAGWQVIFSQNT